MSSVEAMNVPAPPRRARRSTPRAVADVGGELAARREVDARSADRVEQDRLGGLVERKAGHGVRPAARARSSSRWSRSTRPGATAVDRRAASAGRSRNRLGTNHWRRTTGMPEVWFEQLARRHVAPTRVRSETHGCPGHRCVHVDQAGLIQPCDERGREQLAHARHDHRRVGAGRGTVDRRAGGAGRAPRVRHGSRSCSPRRCPRPAHRMPRWSRAVPGSAAVRPWSSWSSWWSWRGRACWSSTCWSSWCWSSSREWSSRWWSAGWCRSGSRSRWCSSTARHRPTMRPHIRREPVTPQRWCPGRQLGRGPCARWRQYPGSLRGQDRYLWRP